MSLLGSEQMSPNFVVRCCKWNLSSPSTCRRHGKLCEKTEEQMQMKKKNDNKQTNITQSYQINQSMTIVLNFSGPLLLCCYCVFTFLFISVYILFVLAIYAEKSGQLNKRIKWLSLYCMLLAVAFGYRPVFFCAFPSLERILFLQRFLYSHEMEIFYPDGNAFIVCTRLMLAHTNR